MNRGRLDLGGKLRRYRLMANLTLRELAMKSGVSAAHLSRIEKGERYPSAGVLHQLAKPLGVMEAELFVMAGFLDQSATSCGNTPPGLDPYVSQALTAEPPQVQRAVLGIINILRSLSKS